MKIIRIIGMSMIGVVGIIALVIISIISMLILIGIESPGSGRFMDKSKKIIKIISEEIDEIIDSFINATKKTA